MIFGSLFFFLASMFASMPQQPAKGTLRFVPNVIDVERDSSGFVQARVMAYSAAGDSIRINGIQGSCQCATASVQQRDARDTIPAKLYLGINAKHFTDSVNYVDYTITTSASAQPASYRVVVRIPAKQHTNR